MSQTTTSLPVRSLIGPLTTTFTAPPSCAVTGVVGAKSSIVSFEAWQGCSEGFLIDTSSCWPSIEPSFWSSWLAVQGPAPQSQAFHGLGFYPPGVYCPSGYTSACTAVSVSAGQLQPSLATEFGFQFPLEPGETAIGCCPPGLTCTSNGAYGQTCGGFINPATVTLGICDTDSFSSVHAQALKDPITYIYADDGFFTGSTTVESMLILAPLIQLNQRATDVTSATSTSPTTSTTPAVDGQMSPTGSATSSPSSQDSGISSGAKIAIGVAVPLAVLAFTAILAYIWLWRRRRQHPQTTMGPSELSNDTSKRLVEAPTDRRYELQERDNVGELDGMLRSEVSGWNPAELGDNERTSWRGRTR